MIGRALRKADGQEMGTVCGQQTGHGQAGRQFHKRDQPAGWKSHSSSSNEKAAGAEKWRSLKKAIFRRMRRQRIAPSNATSGQKLVLDHRAEWPDSAIIGVLPGRPGTLGSAGRGSAGAGGRLAPLQWARVRATQAASLTICSSVFYH